MIGMAYKHNVLTAVEEIPKAIEDTLKSEKDAIEKASKRIVEKNPKIIYIVGHTNSFIGFGARYAFEELTRIPTIPLPPNELVNYESAISKKHFVILVSETGNSPGPVEAAKYLQKKKVPCLAITNTKGSRLQNACEESIITHAYHEAHAITGHNAILAVLYKMAIDMAKEQDKIDTETLNELECDLLKTPDIVRSVLIQRDAIKEIAQACKDDKDIFVIGGGPNYATAVIGGWLLGECVGLHAVGLDVEEVAHGPLYMGYPGMPLIAIAPEGKNYNKIASLIKVIKDIGLKIIVLSNKEKHFNGTFRNVKVPADISEMFTPLCYIAPMELFIYYSAIVRGKNPDVIPNFDILKKFSRLS
jgi:glucosamine--fructose-6-phosphate aminotransferase (isomerizing)